MSLRDKMLAVMADVNASVLEREELVELIAIALLTRKNLFILGDPGQYHCFSDRIWQCDANGDRWSGNPCDGDQYGCCRFVYQNKKLDGQTGKS